LKYDLSNPFKAECAQQYLNDLITKKCHIELREMKGKRNLDQNGLYWVWLTCIQEETGMLKDEVHCLYRAMFLPKMDEYITNIIRPELWNKLKPLINQFHYFKGLSDIIDIISESSTEQDEKQFTEYLNKIKVHARANMGVILVNLEEKNFIEFYKEYGFK
jgi:RPA family protein